MSKTSLVCFLLRSIVSTVVCRLILAFFKPPFDVVSELTLRFLAGAMFVEWMVRSWYNGRILNNTELS